MAEAKEKKPPQKAKPKFKQFDGAAHKARRMARHKAEVVREGQKVIKVPRGTARAKRRQGIQQQAA